MAFDPELAAVSRSEPNPGRGRRTSRLVLAVALAAGCAAVALALAYHILLDYTLSWDYNLVRLQRTFALAAGEPIFPPRDSGVVLNTIYGPVGALAYLPATAIASPVRAVLAGQVLSVLFFFLPLAWLHFRGAIGDRRRTWLAFWALLAFAALAMDFKPLEYVAFSVHVDAPALALAMLACGVLMRGPTSPDPPKGTHRFALAAVYAALAVWTKLTILPLLAALPLWVLATGGYRQARRFLGILVIALTGVSTVMAVLFGPIQNVIFNMWTVPAHQALGRAEDPHLWSRVLSRLAMETWGIWLLAAGAAVLVVRHRRAGWIRDPGWGYGLVGLALVPMMIFATVKEGGDINNMAYPAYFLLAGVSLSLAALARETVTARRILVAIPALILPAVLIFQEPGTLRTLTRPLPAGELPHQIAYDYARAHPGEIYFPRMTLVHLLAEGEVYHQVIGILDRAYAEFPLKEDHLRAHLPPGMRGIAFYENVFMTEIEYYESLGFSRQIRDPELPGFVIWVPPAGTSPPVGVK